MEKSRPWEHENDIFKVQYNVTVGVRPTIPDIKKLVEIHKFKKGSEMTDEDIESKIKIYVDLMVRCWDQDQKKRPSFDSISLESF